MKTIATLTINPSVDMFLEVARMAPGQKLRCPAPIYVPGGGGINVSRAIRRLGGAATAVFPSGGAPGALLETLLAREDIPFRAIPIAEPTRQDVNVTERASGHDFRFVVPGPEVGIDEWRKCLDALRTLQPRPDIIVASGSLPPSVPVDFYGRVAAIARELGIKLIVDTTGEPLRHAGSPGTFMLKPSISELAAICGGASGTALEQAAYALVTSGRAQVVVVSAGAAGALIADAGGIRRIEAPIVPAASRIGSGDSMVAGIALALARGWDVDDAVQFGVAAGSAAAAAPGHQLCSRDVTETLFEQMHALRADAVRV